MAQFYIPTIFLVLVCRVYAQTETSELKTNGLSVPSENDRGGEPAYYLPSPIFQEILPFEDYDFNENGFEDEYMQLMESLRQVEMIEEPDYEEGALSFLDFVDNDEVITSEDAKMEMEDRENDSDELKTDSASNFGIFEGFFLQTVYPPQYDTFVDISDQQEREQFLKAPKHDFGGLFPSSQDSIEQRPSTNIVEPKNKYVNIFLQNKVNRPDEELLDTSYRKGSTLQILKIVRESIIFVPTEFKENRDRPILPISREHFDIEEERRVGYGRFVLLMGPLLMGLGLLFFCLACITKRKEKCRRKTTKKTEVQYKPMVNEV